MIKQRLTKRFRLIATLSVVLAGLWAIARVGFGTIPGISSAANNAFGWPTNELAQYSAFSATSPTGAVVFTILGRDEPSYFLVIHLVAVAVAIALTLWVVAAMTPLNSRQMSMRLVLLSPWVALLFIFVGSYDPFTIIGFALLLWSWKTNKKLLVVCAGIYLGFQHFEQSVFAVLAAVFIVQALRNKLPRDLLQRRQIVSTFAGIIIGKILLTVILDFGSDSDLFGRSAFWSAEWIRISLVTSANFWAVFLLSLFAGSWALVVATAFSVNRRRQIYFLGGIGICLLPALVTLDHTRVFVMTSMISLTLITIAFARTIETSKSRNVIIVESMAWLIVPMSVWVGMDGTPYLNPAGSIDQFIIFINQFNNL